MRAAALAGLLTLVASGCGGDQPGSGGEPASSLEIALDPDGSGGQEAQTAQLSCPGDASCAELARITRADLAQVPPRTACTEIFGGPEVVTIEGELEGDAVTATLNRANGCEIARFGKVLPLIQALFPDYEAGSALRP